MLTYRHQLKQALFTTLSLECDRCGDMLSAKKEDDVVEAGMREGWAFHASEMLCGCCIDKEKILCTYNDNDEDDDE